MHLLEVKALRVLYGKAIALNGMTLNLDEKEMVGVVGPNGAGKSTLLRAISALIPAEGEIFIMASGSIITPLMKLSVRGSSIARREGSSLWNFPSGRTWRWGPFCERTERRSKRT